MRLNDRDPGYKEWLRWGTKLVLPAGDVIFPEGDHAGMMYLVVKGQVALANVSDTGRRFVSREAGPGDVFGEESMLPQARYLHSGEAVTASTVVGIRTEDVVTLLQAGGEFATQLTETLSQRIAEAEQLASLLALHDAGDRVLGVILVEASQHGGVVGLTHRKLAERAAVAREVVTTTLNRLQRKGVLRLGRGVIRLAELPHRGGTQSIRGSRRSAH